MTILRFSGGETIEVGLEIGQVRELLQKALAQNALLELEDPTGETLVINPQQVQFLQNGSVEPFPAASASSSTAS